MSDPQDVRTAPMPSPEPRITPAELEHAKVLLTSRECYGFAIKFGARLLAEVERLRGEVHDCPKCGLACKQCLCVEADLAARGAGGDQGEVDGTLCVGNHSAG